MSKLGEALKEKAREKARDKIRESLHEKKHELIHGKDEEEELSHIERLKQKTG